MELYLDASKTPQERAEDLLGQMTLEEKLAQMMGYNSALWSSEDLDRDYPYGAGQVSFFGGMKEKGICEAAEYQRETQKRLMEKSRFGIPAIFHVEGLCGVMLPEATSFPSGIAQGATFDPAHQKQVYAWIGQQARAAGASQVFAPVLDISRDSRFGRQGEPYGEDPALASALGCAAVSGLQQDGDYEKGVLATAKHFLGYHDSQGGIHAAACDIPERLLREIYAKPFQAAITEADLQSMMPCYSSINGEPVAASHGILTDLLRGEMGFRGLTVSDYSSVGEIYSRHHVGESEGEAGRRAILAGMHQELPSADCFRPEKLLEDGVDPRLQEAIDGAVRVILTEKFRLGLFEHPYAFPKEELRKAYQGTRGRELSRKSAQESMVLVKNDGILPLSKEKRKIAVIGYHGDSVTALFGGYTYLSMTESFLGARMTMAGVGKQEEGCQSREGRPQRDGPDLAHWPGSVVDREHLEAEKRVRELLPDCRSLLEELRFRLPEAEVAYAFGYPYVGDDCSGHGEALRIAAEADVVLMTVGGKYGTGSTASMGEGIDAAEIRLPPCQERLIERIGELGKPLVLVHFDGRPISSDGADQYADAILEAWNPGECGAEAVVSVLTGVYNPGGRMPVTTPRCSGQIPVYYNHPNGSSWHQGTISAFTRYVDCPHEPRYCFGHGLSYTRFCYEDLRIEKEHLSPQETQTVSLRVTNSGDRDGDEVVQLYLRDPQASMVRPVKELAGFCRVHLKKGESRQLLFRIRASQLAFLDGERNWLVEKGRYEVQAGASSEDIRLTGAFFVTESARIEGRTRAFWAEVYHHEV